MGSRRSPSKPLSFYSVVHSDQQKGLMMPEKFTAKHGKDLKKRKRVTLKVPDGRSWEMDLADSDGGGLCLGKGWPEFAGHYGLSFGDFIVFKYDGKSIFNVIIFYPSASEMEYSQPQRKKEVEIPVDDHNNKRGSRAKKARISQDDDGGGASGRWEAVKTETETEGDSESEREGRQGRVRSGGSTSSRNKAYESAKGFKSDNPFFIVSMAESYINGRSGLPVRKVFQERYWRSKNDSKKRKSVEEVALQLSNGHVWGSVERHAYSLGATGWKKFAADNGVKVGDVCVCELISRDQNVLRVHIYSN